MLAAEGIGLREHLPRRDIAQDAPVAPEVDILDVDAARLHDAHLAGDTARPQKDFALRVGLAARTAAGKHLGQRHLANALERGVFCVFTLSAPFYRLTW